ncbi:TPA: hypothetical protein ACWZSZ_002370 [Escherichia coli]
MTPHEWECVFDRTRITFTDLWLIFFNKISVEYKVERQESDFIEVSVKFKASNICCIPFSFNNYGSLNAVYCNAMSYLDFNTVSYHSFKTVATKGWNRNKYSHLLFIHQSSSSDKGGFLIGVQYEKNDVTFSDKSAFSPYEPLEEAIPDPKKDRVEGLSFPENYAPYSDVNPELKIRIHHAPGNIKIKNLTPELKSKIE